jgi:hypothetical protein
VLSLDFLLFGGGRSSGEGGFGGRRGIPSRVYRGAGRLGGLRRELLFPYYDPSALPMPLESLSLFRLMTSFRDSELAMIGESSTCSLGSRSSRWRSPDFEDIGGHRRRSSPSPPRGRSLGSAFS